MDRIPVDVDVVDGGQMIDQRGGDGVQSREALGWLSTL